VRRVDRWLGLALAALAAAVLWSSFGFPAVPGQKIGAGFLPGLIGVGLLACALGLVWRGVAPPAPPLADLAPPISTGGADPATEPALPPRRVAPAVVLGVIAAYIALADRIGFLLLVPLLLCALFLALEVRPRAAIGWAIGGTLVVHLVFYKLLRVPLPWGVLRPFY
jgi:putative tricarboxylic transport membrane protein